MPNRSRASWADRRQAYFRPPWPASSWGRPARSLNAAYHRTRRPRCSSIGGCAQAQTRDQSQEPCRGAPGGRQEGAGSRPAQGAAGTELAGDLQRRWPLRGTSTSAETPSRRRASARCWRRNVRRAPDDERRDAVRRCGRRPHDRMRGAAGSAARLSNWGSGSARLPSYCPAAAQQATGSPEQSDSGAHWRKACLFPGDALDLGWGAPGMSLSLAHHSRTRTALPPIWVRRGFCGMVPQQQ